MEARFSRIRHQSALVAAQNHYADIFMQQFFDHLHELQQHDAADAMEATVDEPSEHRMKRRRVATVTNSDDASSASASASEN